MRTILDTVGHTPTIVFQRLTTHREAQMCLKLERTNPGGSIKDRPAKYIIEAAEHAGWLAPGGTIIESSSGNFGISLAMIGAAKGYRVIILVDPKTTPANLALLRAYGAEVIVVTEQDDTGSYHKTRIAKANHLAAEIPGAFRPDQCFNLLNSEAHYHHTAREILEDCQGDVAVIVAAASTGGQLGGLSRYVKHHHPTTRIVGVDAIGSAIFGGASHSYLMPGVGLGWTPTNLDVALLDGAYNVPDEEAFLMCRHLAQTEGVMVGASSGAVVLVGLKFAQELDPATRIVCVAADSGERYLHTIFNDQWMEAHQLATATDWALLRDRARMLQPTHPQRAENAPSLADLSQQLAIPSSTHAINNAILLASEVGR